MAQPDEIIGHGEGSAETRAMPEPAFSEVAEEPVEAITVTGRSIFGGLLVLLTLGWLSLCTVALLQARPPLTLINIVSWTATISVPIALLGLFWLLFGRTSRVETERFTRAVAQMRSEAESLDRVLAAVAERLEGNRAQLSGDSARLMKLGEEASDRLGRVTHFLAREGSELERRSAALESAAAQARVDMGVLLADLPLAEQAARTFSETLREAGTTAHERARALEAQLSAIAARAQDADTSTGGAAERLSAHIARIETSAGVAAGQLDEARQRLDAAVDGALVRTGEAVEVTRLAVDAQAQALLASIEQGRARFAEAGAQTTRDVSERLETARRDFVEATAASGRDLAAELDQARLRLVEAGTKSGQETAERLDSAQQRLIEAGAQSGRELAERLDSSRQRLLEAGAEAGREIEQRLAGAQQLFAAAGEQARNDIASQLGEAQRLIDAVASSVAAQEAASRALVDRLGQEIAGLDERLASLGTRADAQSAQMATALAGLRDATATLRQEVDASTHEAVALVARAQDMAGALDAVTARLGTELSPALADVERRAAAARETALAAVEPVQAVREAAAEGAARLAEAEASANRQGEALQALLAAIGDGVSTVEAKLRELSAAVNSTDDAASLLVRETGPELVDALVRVREAARLAGAHAREAISSAIPESAAALAEAVQTAVGSSVTDAVREQIAGIDAASQHAALAARKATERLTRQLLTLGESAAALEAKIEEERALRDEQERGGMSRRVALLIESLNSTAIDVTKILSNDVTDTAWSAYLKGDRGVFTRRAVRLLESGEAREIARHYDEEPEFREQVNRYVSDFENMLRRVLTDSEGDTFSVALLSSDMGKLYVALAQAIDRLRR